MKRRFIRMNKARRDAAEPICRYGNRRLYVRYTEI